MSVPPGRLHVLKNGNYGNKFEDNPIFLSALVIILICCAFSLCAEHQKASWDLQ